MKNEISGCNVLQTQQVKPFLGGASVFLSINPTQKAFLSDLNKELVDTYNTVKTNVDEVIIELKKYKNTENFYYQIREEEPTNKVKQAARLIYLNKICFNGYKGVIKKANSMCLMAKEMATF